MKNYKNLNIDKLIPQTVGILEAHNSPYNSSCKDNQLSSTFEHSRVKVPKIYSSPVVPPQIEKEKERP